MKSKANIKPVSWVAHRGYPLRYPENTEVGLSAAVKAGARYVEIDVQLTADQQAVLFHDRHLQRLCGREGAIHQMTMDEVAQLRVPDHQRMGYRFAQTPVMTLTAFRAWLSQRPQVTAFVELKRISIEQFGVDAVVNAVTEVLRPLQKQVVIISYHLPALLAIRAGKVFPIGAVFDEWRESKQTIIRQLRPEYLFCDWQGLPRWGRVQNAYGKLAVFECTDASLAQELVKRGVDLVETFAIGEMIRDEPLIGPLHGQFF